MCGIIGVKVVKAKKIRKNIKRIYRHQAHRGTDGYGIAIGVNGGIVRHRSKGEGEIFNPSNWRGIKNGASVLFHHRIPTSTPNLPACNHPIMNEKMTMALVHNGMVSQHVGIWDDLEKAGHKFETEITYNAVEGGKRCTYSEITDSEVLVHLLEGYKDFEEGVKKLEDTIGYFSAFALIRKNDDKIYLYSNGAPLCVYEDRYGNTFFSSEHPYGHFYKELTLAHGEYGYIDENGYKKLGNLEHNWRQEGRFYGEGDYDYGKGYWWWDKDDQLLAGGDVLPSDELEAKMDEWRLTERQKDEARSLIEVGYSIDEAIEEVLWCYWQGDYDKYGEKYQKYKGKQDEYYRGQSEVTGVKETCRTCGDVNCSFRGTNRIPFSTCFTPDVKETNCLECGNGKCKHAGTDKTQFGVCFIPKVK